MTETDVFKHSTPDLYDRYMVPLLFEPWAKLVAERSARLQPDRILETAAGTGVVTRAVYEAVPKAQIVATDVNPAALEYAAQRVRSELGRELLELPGPAREGRRAGQRRRLASPRTELRVERLVLVLTSARRGRQPHRLQPNREAH